VESLSSSSEDSTGLGTDWRSNLQVGKAAHVGLLATHVPHWPLGPVSEDAVLLKKANQWSEARKLAGVRAYSAAKHEAVKRQICREILILKAVPCEM